MAAPPLRIRLLGGFDLRYGESRLPPIGSARAESLLAYLVLHRATPQPRQHLAFQLWPDSTEAQARTNLRHLLHTLRQAFPDADRFLDVTPRTIQWRADADYRVDVFDFLDALSKADQNGSDAAAALRDAVATYTGDLLKGRYDEWILTDRALLRDRYLNALERLALLLADRGESAEAIPFAERLLRHDPLHEDSYRLLMRLHHANGDRARALRVYHVCAATLERELGVEPSAATRAVYEALVPAERETAVAVHGGERLGRPPLVGRTAEWSRLTALWRATAAGRAHFVLVSGEPGIGKTRLVEELQSWCAHNGVLTAEARSYPAEGALAYGLVVTWLRSEALRPGLSRLDRAHLTELTRLLPELLSGATDIPHPEPMSTNEQRQHLFDAITRAILSTASPLLLVADDLQWCDTESLQFLHYLLRVEPDAPVLVAGTVRREEIDPRHPVDHLVAGLHALDRCSEINLQRLTRAETASLAARIGGRTVERADLSRLHDETEGSPLFVVEAMRAGWTDDSAQPKRLSPRVQAAIETRLAQLSEPARELVGIAATIGREFTTDILADASDTDEDALVGCLDELWRRRIIREQGASGYDFSHDKIREVAYSRLSPVRRRRYHLRVARTLERLRRHDPDAVAGQIAAHNDAAGAVDQAIDWYERAAEPALRLHANAEAIRLIDRAIALLRAQPATAERQRRELSLLSVLSTPLGLVDGWGSERLTALQRRALELAGTIGIESEPPLLRSLAIAALSRRDFATARGLGNRLRQRAEGEGNEVLLVEADYVLGIAAFWQGNFATARGHFEAAVDRYRPEHRRDHLLLYGLEPKVICLSRLGNTLWFLGYPESAVRARTASHDLAEEIGHPFSLATALVFGTMLSLDMGDTAGVRAYAAKLARGQGKDGAAPPRISTEATCGYIDVLDGQTQRGITRIQRTLDEAQEADHAPGMRAHLIRILLAAYVAAEDAQGGLAAADRALAMDDGVGLWEAETRRLRAEFLASLSGPVPEVEAELERALDVARRQGAKMLEFRTAASLARHRQAAGNPRLSQAREQLAAIVATLPEGRDSREVIEAITLLDRD